MVWELKTLTWTFCFCINRKFVWLHRPNERVTGQIDTVEKRYRNKNRLINNKKRLVISTGHGDFGLTVHHLYIILCIFSQGCTDFVTKPPWFSSLAKLGWNLAWKWKHGTWQTWYLHYSCSDLELSLWYLLIWGSCCVVSTCCSWLYQTLLIGLCVCVHFGGRQQICFGCVPGWTHPCLSMINKGLNFPPSPLCILLFLGCMWWAQGLELQHRLCLFLVLSSSASLHRSSGRLFASCVF